jgi:hypothetical protein
LEDKVMKQIRKEEYVPMKRSIFVLVLGFVFAATAPPHVAVAALIATFDDFTLSVPPAINYTGPGGGQYYNGSDEAGGFTSGGANFVNNYNASWGSWDGWSVSNTVDLTTAGYTNQYSAYNAPSGGAHNSDNYGVFFETFGPLAPTVTFGVPVTLSDVWITNTTYAHLAVVDGKDGNNPPLVTEFGAGDWFKVTVWGFDALGKTTTSLDMYLADYRDANPDNWYALDTWTLFDLSSLGPVYGLGFDLESTDYNLYGMATPAYFAMDDLAYRQVPIPGTVLLLGSGLLALVGIRRRL